MYINRRMGMKYNILGFSQESSMELELNTDDLLLLRWFIDFKETGAMKKKFLEKENRCCYLVSYKKIIEDLPILVRDCKVKEHREEGFTANAEERLLNTQKQKLKRMFQGNLGNLLIRHVERDSKGTFLYVYIHEDNYTKLLFGSGVSIKGAKEDDMPSSEDEKCTTPSTDLIVGDDEKCTDGLVKIDQTKINLLKNSSIKDKDNIYSQVVTYLNEKCESNFKVDSKKTRLLIRARAKEGFSLEDFKRVIDKKSEQWLGTVYEKYLRPETLFGNKFEGYLNEKEGNFYGSSKAGITGEDISKSKSSKFNFEGINNL